MNSQGNWKPESYLEGYEEVLDSKVCPRCYGLGIIYLDQYSALISEEDSEECLLCNGGGILIFVIKTSEKT